MKRSRVPGPLVHTQTLGNSGDRIADGVSRWISVDVNDGSGWTAKVGANSIGGNLISLTTSGNGMEITQDITLDNKNWNQNAHTADRYYKELKIDSGRSLLWSDIFSIEFLLERTAQGAQDRAGISVGLIDSNGHTGTSNLSWVGVQGYNRNNNAGMILRIGSGGGNGEVEDADGAKLYGVFTPAVDDDDGGDSNPQLRRGIGLMLNSSNEVIKSAAMPDTSDEFTATDKVYLFMSPCFRNTTSQSSNPVDTWRVWYRLSYSEDNLSPTYIPGGGVSR